MIEVLMNADEVFVAHLVGERRNALNYGDKNFPDSAGKRLLQHKSAALAEMAVAKHYNLYWSGLGKGTEGRGDVGGKWEVRSITQAHHGLIVRESDPARPHLLVLVEEPRCSLIGWLWPEQARILRYYKADSPQGETPFWLVPQADLIPLTGRKEKGVRSHARKREALEDVWAIHQEGNRSGRI